MTKYEAEKAPTSLHSCESYLVGLVCDAGL